MREYLASVSTNDMIAVAKGKCDCACPLEHPLVQLERVMGLTPGNVTTAVSCYSGDTGDNLLGEGGEYDSILNPDVSLDARYLLLEYALVMLENERAKCDDSAQFSVLSQKVDLINSELDELADSIMGRY